MLNLLILKKLKSQEIFCMGVTLYFKISRNANRIDIVCAIAKYTLFVL